MILTYMTLCSEQLWDKQYQITNQYHDRFNEKFIFCCVRSGCKCTCTLALILKDLYFFKQGARNLNPIPYYAEYFGHKLHMDQNEKLVMFGVTHVLAIDGFSSKIVGCKSMPVKNNILIYDSVYR